MKGVSVGEHGREGFRETGVLSSSPSPFVQEDELLHQFVERALQRLRDKRDEPTLPHIHHTFSRATRMPSLFEPAHVGDIAVATEGYTDYPTLEDAIA